MSRRGFYSHTAAGCIQVERGVATSTKGGRKGEPRVHIHLVAIDGDGVSDFQQAGRHDVHHVKQKRQMGGDKREGTDSGPVSCSRSTGKRRTLILVGGEDDGALIG